MATILAPVNRIKRILNFVVVVVLQKVNLSFDSILVGVFQFPNYLVTTLDIQIVTIYFVVFHFQASVYQLP